MTQQVYRHPAFVSRTNDKRIENENKRLWLSLTIDKNCNETIVVILKNPSRATKDISDKTVSNVTKYIHNNRNKYSQFKSVGTIIILNLIPYYETYSNQLLLSTNNIIDKKNLKVIKELTTKHKNIIAAWGDPPKGLLKEYEILKNLVLDHLKFNENNVFYVDKISKKGNPKHGQVWSHKNPLMPFNTIL